MRTQIEILKKYNLPIRGHSGQHLLIDPNIQRKIVDLLEPSAKDKILEIGPGLGALTGKLLERGCYVTAVEKDERFIPVLESELGGKQIFPKMANRGQAVEYSLSPMGNQPLKIIHSDILKLDLKKLFPRTSKTKPQKIKVISNLPYYATAPIIFHLIEYREMISKAVLTMQKEVAARLFAMPGSKDYSRMTLALRYYTDVREGFDIPPTCFTPQPEVSSSVVVLTFHSQKELPSAADEKFLFHLIQIAFSQRRKTLMHLLTRDPAIKVGRSRLSEIFRSHGFSEKVRGEELLLKDYLALAGDLNDKGDHIAGT